MAALLMDGRAKYLGEDLLCYHSCEFQLRWGERGGRQWGLAPFTHVGLTPLWQKVVYES